MTLFHEQMHGVAKILGDAARGGNAGAAELARALAAKYGAPLAPGEAFNEEAFADAFRDFVAGKIDVAEEERGLFGRFVDFVRSLFSRAEEAARERTLMDEFFEQAAGGRAVEAVAADDAAHHAEGAEGAEGAARSSIGERDGMPSAEEVAEARHQYDAVVARYTNPDGTKKPGWMKAPNGAPTRLTERQWVQVRTENFKRWFGDWEAAALRNAIEATPVYDFARPADGELAELVRSYSEGGNENERRILDWAEKLIPRTVETAVGTVETTRNSIRSILFHSRNRKMRGPLKVLALAQMGEILKTAVEYHRETDGGATFYNLANRITFDGAHYLVRITVKETESGRRTYTAEFQNMESDGAANAEAPQEGQLTRSTPRSILQSLYAVNPQNASKVVDENGEPLVVWHGTHWDPFAEEPGKAVFRDAYRGTGSGDNGFFGRGFYFAFTEDEAQTYGRRTGGYFLNLRNPFVFIDEMDFIDGLRTFDMDGADVAPIVNLSDKFPETASMFTVTGWTFDANGEGTPTEESLRDFAKEIRAILAEPEIRERRDPITEALSEFQKRHGFGSVDIPRITEVSQEPEFTDELKKKGHDGVLQSKDGDEAVAFSHTQIKSATDNAGTFGGERGDIRASIGHLYTGSAADYAERVPVLDKDGNVTGYRIDNAPSLQHVGTGEGSQVYGWGLYASDQRGVAEKYARDASTSRLNVYRNGRVDLPDSNETISIHRAIHYVADDDGSFTKRDVLAFFDERIASMRRLARETRVAAYESGIPGDEAAKRLFEETADEWTARRNTGNLYEQTFFTDRADGEETERHLLKWYEPVSEEQMGWIEAQIEKEHYRNNIKYLLREAVKDIRKHKKTKGSELYSAVAGALNMEPSAAENRYKAASEFLARAGIDGIKYPVDSFGGKTVNDGDVAGWNYVSFRDDNIRVDHKWVDGEKRYSIGSRSGVTPEEDAAYMDAVRRGDMKTAQKMVDEADKQNGYTVDVYHGTQYPGFFKFKDDETGGVYVSSKMETSKTYVQEVFGDYGDIDVLPVIEKFGSRPDMVRKAKASGRPGIYHLALRPGRTLTVDAHGKSWNELSEADGLPEEIRPIAPRLHELIAVRDYDGNGNQLIILRAVENEKDLDDESYPSVLREYGKFKGWTKEETENYDPDLVTKQTYWIGGEVVVAYNYPMPFSGISELNAFLQRLSPFYKVTEEDFGFEIDEYGYKTEVPDGEPSSKHLNPKAVSVINTRRVAAFAEANGYDSVHFQNVVDNGGNGNADASDVWWVRKSNQLKMRNPVTYDDAGNVIPLSQRFDPRKEDIRYSIGTRDGVENKTTAQNLTIDSAGGGGTMLAQGESSHGQQASQDQPEPEPDDEFRRLQEESRGMPGEVVRAYHSGLRVYDEGILNRLRDVLSRRVGAARRRNGYGVQLLTNGKTGADLRIGRVDGATFHDVFEIARQYLKYGDLVDLHDSYGDDVQCWLSDDGLSGFAVEPDGNIVSVFSLGGGGFLRTVFPLIRKVGGRKLDCYALDQERNLPSLYEKHFGFRRAASMAYDESFEPEDPADERHGFGQRHGMPRIVFMVADPGHAVEEKSFDGDYDGAVAWQGANLPPAPQSESAPRSSIGPRDGDGSTPPLSRMDLAVAFAARDAMTGRDRSDEDYARLIRGLGVGAMYTPDELRRAGRAAAATERMRGEGKAGTKAWRAEMRTPSLRALARNARAQRMLEEAIRSAYRFGERAGARAGAKAGTAEAEARRRGEEAARRMLAKMMRSAQGLDVKELDAILGVPAPEMMARISEVLFSGAKAPGQVRERRGGGAADGGAAPADADTAAPAGESERTNYRSDDVLAASQFEAGRLAAMLDAIRDRILALREAEEAKARERARKRAEREEREAEDAKPVGNDDMPEDAEEGDGDSGDADEDVDADDVRESEGAEADPDLVRQFLAAMKSGSLDLSTATDFALAVQAFVECSVTRETGVALDAVLEDPVQMVRYRKTMIDFLKATADALLDPGDGASAKWAERRIGDIPDDATRRQLFLAARDILGYVQRNGLNQSRRRMVRGIDRYLKRVAGKAKRLDPLAPDLTRRMTALAVQDARYLRHVLKLTAGGVRREQEALQELIDGRRAQGADEGDAHIDRALRRMALLEQFGGLRHRMPAEIEVARRYIEEHYEEEVRRMAERVEARRARLGALSDALIKAADGVREALGGTDADAPGTGARVLDALAGVLADTRSHMPEAARLSDLELAALYLAQMTKDASTLAAAAPSNTIEYLIGAGIRADIAR